MKLPHLKGCMTKLEGEPGQGLCIHRAAAFVLDTPGADLCFGIMRAATPDEIAAIPNASREPFIHAWAEHRGLVFAPTLIERMGGLYPMLRDSYYGENGITDVRRLSRPDLLRIAREIGLSAHLRLGKPARASVGGTLLDAVGMRHRISPQGGLVPE